jgi:hypothetical protein
MAFPRVSGLVVFSHVLSNEFQVIEDEWRGALEHCSQILV